MVASLCGGFIQKIVARDRAGLATGAPDKLHDGGVFCRTD